MGKIKIEIKEKMGTCESSLFEKMASRGDITAKKAKECDGLIFSLKGYAKAVITNTETGETFDVVYYDTNCGMISTGSEIFFDSIKTYLEDCNKFQICSYKSKRGTGFKAVPVLFEEVEE